MKKLSIQWKRKENESSSRKKNPHLKGLCP
jgi:hypothetical protein